MATVICLDDYHALDRKGRKEKGVTALAPEAQDFELMYNQIKDMKAGKPVQKPIYNHVTGLLDPPEEIKAPKARRPRPRARRAAAARAAAAKACMQDTCQIYTRSGHQTGHQTAVARCAAACLRPAVLLAPAP
jgi:hypothetical protein